MMNCADLEVLLSDYADGAADARTRRIVERHVQLCDRCRLRVQRARQVGLQLQRLPLLPPGISSRVGRFRRRLEGRSARGRWRLEHYPFYVSALLAALLITLALFTVFYFHI
jgi:anti-sigma factor RsiW